MTLGGNFLILNIYRVWTIKWLKFIHGDVNQDAKQGRSKKSASLSILGQTSCLPMEPEQILLSAYPTPYFWKYQMTEKYESHSLPRHYKTVILERNINNVLCLSNIWKKTLRAKLKYYIF